jgi:hypothetical protein
MFTVYVLGEWGVLEGVVFKFEIADLTLLSQRLTEKSGGDLVSIQTRQLCQFFSLIEETERFIYLMNFTSGNALMSCWQTK